MLCVFVGAKGELFRFAEQKNGFARQIVEQYGERLDFGGASSTSPAFRFGDSWNSSLRLFQNSQFTRRRQGDARNFLARNLRERIEMAERFQFVAEKFQPHRPRAGERPDIHDAAAQGDFAFLRNLRFRLVALFFEKFNQVERRDFVAARERAGAFLDFTGRKGFLQQRRHAGDNDLRFEI